VATRGLSTSWSDDSRASDAARGSRNASGNARPEPTRLGAAALAFAVAAPAAANPDGLRTDAVQQALDDRSPGLPLDLGVQSQLASDGGRGFGTVRVHADSAAAALAQGIEADAFTRGEHIYFDAGMYAPRTAAGLQLLRHELGHVAQQERGELSRYAGRVVPPEHASETEAASGSALRGTSGFARPAGASIQRQPAKPPLSKDEAPFYLWVLDIVLYYHDPQTIRELTGRYRGPFEKLYGAVAGEDLARHTIADRFRRPMFDEAVLGLREVIAYAGEDRRASLSRRRTDLLAKEASDRVESSIVIGDKAVEIPDAEHPREQAEVLREALKKLIETLELSNEQLHRLAEANYEQYELALEEIEHSPHLDHLGKLLEQLDLEQKAVPAHRIVHSIGALQALLATFDGWLTLTDDELREHLNEIHKVLPTVSSFAELVKAVVEIGLGTVSLTAVFAAALAKAIGEGAMAADALAVAGAVGGVLANVVAGIEIVHGIFVLLDPDATPAQKEKAAVGVLTGSAWFIGSRIGGFAMGGPASVAILGGYLMLKVAAAMYWQAALAINTWLMSPVFEYMASHGETIARVGDRVARAALLLRDEHDPLRARPLAQTLAENEDLLATTVDDLLEHSLPGRAEDLVFGRPNVIGPGYVTMFLEAFAPLQGYRGVKSGPQLAEAAAHVLLRINWLLAHGAEIVVASTRQQHLRDVAQDPSGLEPRASREGVLRELGTGKQLRIEFTAKGYRPQEATIVKTVVPGLDVLWFATGTNPSVTLGDLAGAAPVVIEGEIGGYPIRFVRDASGKLTYEDIPSFTQDYFRGVAKALGLGAKTMQEESFAGMVQIYARLITTPVSDAHLRP
jgi:hypothetical protein